MLSVGLVDDVVDNFISLIYVLTRDNCVKFVNFFSENRGVVLG